MALSLRQLWTIYKKILANDGMSKRDLILAQHSFYNGAHGVLKVLDYMFDHGEDDEVRQTVRRQARLIKAIQGLRPRARRAWVSIPPETATASLLKVLCKQH
jgi:hypothetical protein